MSKPSAQEVTDKVLQGDQRTAARLMRNLDDRLPTAIDTLKRLYPHTGKARIVGVTGAPGSGKSTLVNELLRVYRKQSLRVGVVAVDPSSPFTGGAILGDRIRMTRHALDDGIFVRSLATRGHLGGLTASAHDMVTVLDAMGFDVILVETVGVGQAEVDIVEAAHLTVVVVVPGLGDEVQAIKAGILEIADVLCVNKADREGVDRTERDLQLMLQLRGHGTPDVPIQRTVASRGIGIDDLVDLIDRNTESNDSAQRSDRLRRRARSQLTSLLREQAVAWALGPQSASFERYVAQIASRAIDPYTAAEQLLAIDRT